MNLNIVNLCSSFAAPIGPAPGSSSFMDEYGFLPVELVSLLARYMDTHGCALPRSFLDRDGVVSFGPDSSHQVQAWKLWDQGMKLGGWAKISDPSMASQLANRLFLPPKLSRSIRLPPLPARPPSTTHHLGPAIPIFSSRTDDTALLIQAVWSHYFALFEVAHLVRQGVGVERLGQEMDDQRRVDVQRGWRGLLGGNAVKLREMREVWRREEAAEMEVDSGPKTRVGLAGNRIRDGPVVSLVDHMAQRRQQEEGHRHQQEAAGSPSPNIQRPSVVSPCPTELAQQPHPYPTPPSEIAHLPVINHTGTSVGDTCAPFDLPSPPPTVPSALNGVARATWSSPSPLVRSRGTLIPLSKAAFEIVETTPSMVPRSTVRDAYVTRTTSGPTRSAFQPSMPVAERQLLFSRGPSAPTHLNNHTPRPEPLRIIPHIQQTDVSPTASPTLPANTSRKRPCQDGLLVPSKRVCAENQNATVDQELHPPLLGKLLVLGADVTDEETRTKLATGIVSLGGTVISKQTQEDWESSMGIEEEVILICWEKKGQEVNWAVNAGAQLRSPVYLSHLHHPNSTANMPLAAQLPLSNPLPGFSSYRISLTSYQPPLRNILVTLIRATGATYSANLTKTCTHLLCPPDGGTGPKVDQAKKFGIRIIRDGRGWLERCFVEGSIEQKEEEMSGHAEGEGEVGGLEESLEGMSLG